MLNEFKVRYSLTYKKTEYIMHKKYLLTIFPLFVSSLSFALPCQEGGLAEKINCLNRKLETLMQINSTLNNKISDAAKIPAGTVVAFAGEKDKIPEGWVLCDGKIILRNGQYSELFNVIGTAHGQGDGSTTFHLPDYRGLFLRGVLDERSSLIDPSAATRGAMNTGGNTGNKVGTYQSDSFAEHSHNSGNLKNSSSYLSYSGSASPNTSRSRFSTDYDGSHSHDYQGPTRSNGKFWTPDGTGMDIATGKTTSYSGNHNHDVYVSFPNYSFSINTNIPAQTISGTTATQGGSETRPKNAYVYYIIKY